MPRTKFISGRSKTEQISSLTRIAVTRLAIGLIIAALIVIGLTSPSGAQINRVARTESTPSSPEQQVFRYADVMLGCLPAATSSSRFR